MPSSIRSIVIAAAVLLGAAPVAQASPLGPDNHAIKIASLRLRPAAAVTAPITVQPVDRVVLERHAALAKIVPVTAGGTAASTTTTATSTGGFDWTFAAVLAGLGGLLFVAIAGGALTRIRSIATGH
jgi:hypothetical protein